MREIKIFAQGNCTFASLVNSGEVLKFETASYNPNDAKQGLPYKFEIGAKLALDRLFDKMKETEKTEIPEPFNWDEFAKGEIAVHCETEIEAKRFLRACKKRGYTWKLGGSLAKETYFDNIVGDVCYAVWLGKGLCFGNCKRFKNLKIAKYIPEVREVKRQAKVGEWIKFTWWEYSGSVELVDKVGKVLDIEEFMIKIEHEKAWTNPRESKKGFEITKFYKSNIKYVVLEGYRGK